MINWQSIYDSRNSNEQCNLFISSITASYNKYFPVKCVTRSSKTAHNLWMTACILKSIKRKNNLYRVKVKSLTPNNIQRFCHYRNKLYHLIRFTKKNYYETMLKKAQGNLRVTWGIINEVLNKKNAEPISVSQILNNDKRYVKDIDIANTFK